MKPVGLRFGALSPKINEQLVMQGVGALASDIKAWQKRADALVCLHLGKVLTDSEVTKARDRLSKQIFKGMIIHRR